VKNWPETFAKSIAQSCKLISLLCWCTIRVEWCR